MPLDGIDWDGCSLLVQAAPGHELELRIDGEHFVRMTTGSGATRQGFRFAPAGDRRMQIQLFAGGVPLHAPVQAVWGEPGLEPFTGPLEPLGMLERQVESYMLTDGSAASVDECVIIMPVYNAAPAVTRCLAALREHTPAGARLLVIDDASTDPAIPPLLAVAAGWPGVTVLRNEVNLGFTRTVNRALAECADAADVVLLNADTVVGPGWLAGLRQAAWADPRHATATAVSDNAGAFSVPELEQANLLPGAWEIRDAARALLQQGGRSFPRLPTGNGFCMYIRHDARRQVGLLDAAAFPRGYGEENDWCQRAEAHGWVHVIAGSVLVAHARSQSFGDAERHALGQAGMAVLRSRYPRYEAMVGAQLWSYERLVLNWRVRRLWREARVAPRPRVLLQQAADESGWIGWEAWQLQQDAGTVRLLDQDGNEQAAAGTGQRHSDPGDWLQRYGFEAVAAGTSTELVRAGTALGIPIAGSAAEIGWAFR